MRILIAEDEPDLRSQYKEFLEQNSHAPITTKDGEECLTVYKTEYKKWSFNKNNELENISPFEVVVLDYQMPKKNGLEVAKEIYQELEKLNVDIKNLKELEPTHAQVRDYLEALTKIQKGRIF